jgi:hypothetical protein
MRPLGQLDSGPGSPRRWWPSTLFAAERVALAYAFVYVFPFPLDLLDAASDGAVSLLGPWSAAWTSVVRHTAARLGLDASILPAGSGDTTFNQVEVLLKLAIAALIAAAWSVRSGGRPAAASVRERIRSLSRYFLSSAMLLYGAAKLVPTQFAGVGPDRLVGSIGDLSPMGLLWTQMGFSPAYQMFAGALEFAAGLLLVTRRTATVGGLLATAVLANVVMLNLCFDVPVKLYSSHLLGLALFVVAPDAGRLATVLLSSRAVASRPVDPFPPASRRWRVARVGARVLLVAVSGVWPLATGLQEWNETRVQVARAAFHGTYRVITFVRAGVRDRDNEDDVRWVRVGIDEAGFLAVMGANGRSRRFGLEIGAADFALRTRGQSETLSLAWDRLGPGRLRVRGSFEGATVEAVLERESEARHALTDRGFHWITEVSFNR